MSVLPFPPGDPGGDLLEQPAVAVRVAERRVREVRAPWYRLEARGPTLVHLADVDAAADEIGAGGVDVVDREDQPVSRPGLSRREALAHVNRALRAGRRELHPADVVAGGEVRVQPPSEALIEALGPVDVGDRQRHDLEPHRDGRGAGNPRRGVTVRLRVAHEDLHRVGVDYTYIPQCAGRARGVTGPGPGPTRARASPRSAKAEVLSAQGLVG